MRRLLEVLDGAELWAVVKADGYGHGALDCGRAALSAGASALCVASVGEALALRGTLREPRIIVLGPVFGDELAAARAARLELIAGERIPEGVPVHVKLDTGMGRWGVSELRSPPRNVVGVMTHLATADSDLDFANTQLERFAELTAGLEGLTRHAANSAAALALPASRLDAARCGIALYGLSPFGTDPAADGLEPVLSWRSEVALARLLHPASRPGTDAGFWPRRRPGSGSCRSATPTASGAISARARCSCAGARRSVLGTVSMDAFAVALEGAHELGAPVTIIGPGLPLRVLTPRVAGTISYDSRRGSRREGSGRGAA